MIKVLLESPFAGKGETGEECKADEDQNIRYARACMRDSLLKGEAPYASHLLYTQKGILDDDIPEERTQGIDAGLIWGAAAEKTVIYLDRGFSTGMKYGVLNAIKAGRPLELRVLSDYRKQFGTTSRVEQLILFEFPTWRANADKVIRGMISSLHNAGKLQGESLAEDLDQMFNHT